MAGGWGLNQFRGGMGLPNTGTAEHQPQVNVPGNLPSATLQPDTAPPPPHPQPFAHHQTSPPAPLAPQFGYQTQSYNQQTASQQPYQQGFLTGLDAPSGFQATWPASPALRQGQFPVQNNFQSHQAAIDPETAFPQAGFGQFEPLQNNTPSQPPQQFLLLPQENYYLDLPEPTATYQELPAPLPPAAPNFFFPFEPAHHQADLQYDEEQPNRVPPYLDPPGHPPPPPLPPHTMPEVIDLTASPPRSVPSTGGLSSRPHVPFGNIIDVDSLPDRPPANNAYPQFGNMPQLSRPRRPQGTHHNPPITGGSTRQRRDNNYMRQLAMDQQRAAQETHRRIQQQERDRFNGQRMNLNMNQIFRGVEIIQMGVRMFSGGGAGGAGGPGSGRDFRPPAALNHSQPAPVIFRPNPPPDPAAIRNADYKPPLPCKAGYTRSPAEDDYLQCVDCGHELGEKGENEKWEEVWTGKCGHVYCGHCACNIRAGILPLPGQKRPRTRHKICTVKECRINLLAKGGMVRVHL
ncbi:hypothetical protein EX30DRAFT_341431 [Ascodesmis nigricans]|uniref:Uncharacterized protein n=1 Tax=Ascodesmis nigricans TaxID=341454 RepID=A0A4V3SIK5_9PEZI|nr:hypothetical protein EX30DRAFT_341431 [Ascodesmis nigricans]